MNVPRQDAVGAHVHFAHREHPSYRFLVVPNSARARGVPAAEAKRVLNLHVSRQPDWLVGARHPVVVVSPNPDLPVASEAMFDGRLSDLFDSLGVPRAETVVAFVGKGDFFGSRLHERVEPLAQVVVLLGESGYLILHVLLEDDVRDRSKRACRVLDEGVVAKK
jgi:hypothetical protein